MRSSVLLSFATLGVTLATIGASSAGAQSRDDILVCRDGTRITSNDVRVCARHGGVDGNATAAARHVDTSNNGTWNRDDRYGRDDRRDARDDRRDGRDERRDARDDRDDDRRDGRWDNRRNDPRYDPNDRDDRYGYGRGYGYGNSRREVYEWSGYVDREIQIHLRGSRAWVQPVGAGDNRSGRGRVLGYIPQGNGNLVVQRLEGRGDVDVIEQPNARNGYQATLRLRDPRGGAAPYRIVVYWEPWNGRYGYGR